MFKKFFYLPVLLLILLTTYSYAQQVGINEDGSLPNANAILDVKSSNKGILIPRMTSAQRQAIPNTKGLLLYDTNTNSFWFNNGTGWQNMLTGSTTTGTGWSLTGNSGTGSSSFLGTTDNTALRFKINNQPAGIIAPGGNTAIGYLTLASNTTGASNTAVGNNALFSNTTAYYNTAVGSHALYANLSGEYNVAHGGFALYNNTAGMHNTVMGYASLDQNTIGEFNAVVGALAGRTNVTGTGNTLIGAAADVFTEDLFNATAIGYQASVEESNKVRIGNGAVTVIEGQVPFTTPSDARFKFGVQEDVKGLDFILKLRPVTYQFNTKQFDAQLRGRKNDTALTGTVDFMDAAYAEAASIRRSGFLAQEVEKAAAASGYNFSGIIKPKSDKDHYSLSYESFVVPLVKSMQEIAVKLNNMEKENQQLKDELKRLQQRLK